MTLPRHHVRRPRLTAALRDAPVALLEAGAGYGKTAVAAELGDDLAVATVRAVLQSPDTHPQSLVGRLLRAVRRAGLDELAARMEAAPTPDQAVDTFLDDLAVRPEPLLIVIDNIGYASACGQLLLRLASDVGDPHHLLLAGRRLPTGAQALRIAGTVTRLGGPDLAFTPAEVAQLMAHRGRAISGASAARLQQVTGGWAAALALAAPQLERAPDPWPVSEQVEEIPASLVRAAGERLSVHERQALAQAAHLPLLLPEVVDMATGAAGLLDAAADAGIPLNPLHLGGAMAMPDPVREHLAGLAPLTGEAARGGAKGYLAAGQVLPAVDTLLAAGLPADAATLLADMPARHIARLDYRHLRRSVEALPAAVLRDHPAVLLRLAIASEVAGQWGARLRTLRRAARALDPAADPGLARELHAEFALELCRYGRWHEAAALARAVLEEAGEAEPVTRARAAEGLAVALCATAGPAGRAQADELLTGAIEVWGQLAEPARVAQTLARRATVIAYADCRHSQAIAGYDEALAATGGSSHQRAAILVLRAGALIDRGDYGEAEGSLAEAQQLADACSDGRLLAQIALARATAASQAADPEQTVAQLLVGEQHRDDWFDEPAGVVFLAEAAQLADRVGQTCAWTYLERALERAVEAPSAVALAEGMLHARSGDAEVGEAALAALLDRGTLVPRERWRVQLLRAAAAHRRGDPRAGQLAARAFDDAAAVSAAALPLVRERGIVEELAELAAGAGWVAAAWLVATDLPATITVLGDFRVTRGGRDVTPCAGRGAQLVKLLAVTGGRAHLEHVAEALWPETAPETGRKRLRNVLNRLRTTAGDLVVRDGQFLVFAPRTRVDFVLFDREAREALVDPTGSRAVALSRSASTRYRGPLLPDDAYVEWTAAPREQARRRQLALLRLLIAAAEAREDLDDALGLLDRAIDLEPTDEDLYLHAARLLVAQGRRSGARRMLDRARAVAASLDVQASPLAAELEARLS